MTRFLPAALAAALLLSACDAQGSTDVETQPVLSAFLEAGAPLASVTITRTVAIGAFYDPAAAAVTDASVEVQLLAADGSVEDTYAYGAYRPDVEVYSPVERPVVLPGRTYRIVAEALGRTLTAETTVPAAFEVVEPPPDEIVYQSVPTGPPLRITTTSVAGRQAVYVISAQALAADRFEQVDRDGGTVFRSLNLPETFGPVAFVRLFLGCDDEGAFLVCENDPTDAASGSSPIINESSYRLLGDGTAVVDLPWLAFGFYGPSEVTLVSLDDAFQDFVETQAVQGGGSTLSPGEIPNVTSNVTGGLGVFGSFAQQTVQLTILEP